VKKRDRSRKNIHGEPHICYYCGQHADSVDHVIPQSTIRMLAALSDIAITKQILRNRALKVWACRECNSLLSDSLQETLEARKTELKMRLLKRYQKILALPTWKERELNQLGYTLRTCIEASAKAKEYIKKRLAW